MLQRTLGTSVLHSMHHAVAGALRVSSKRPYLTLGAAAHHAVLPAGCHCQK